MFEIISIFLNSFNFFVKFLLIFNSYELIDYFKNLDFSIQFKITNLKKQNYNLKIVFVLRIIIECNYLLGLTYQQKLLYYTAITNCDTLKRNLLNVTEIQQRVQENRLRCQFSCMTVSFMLLRFA